jgi:hypothetical protein
VSVPRESGRQDRGVRRDDDVGEGAEMFPPAPHRLDEQRAIDERLGGAGVIDDRRVHFEDRHRVIAAADRIASPPKLWYARRSRRAGCRARSCAIAPARAMRRCVDRTAAASPPSARRLPRLPRARA